MFQSEFLVQDADEGPAWRTDYVKQEQECLQAYIVGVRMFGRCSENFFKGSMSSWLEGRNGRLTFQEGGLSWWIVSASQ